MSSKSRPNLIRTQTKMSQCLLITISVQKVLGFKLQENYYYRNKGVKSKKSVEKSTTNQSNKNIKSVVMLLIKKIGWLSLTSFSLIFYTNMVSDTLDVVRCCHAPICNNRPQLLLRQHAQPLEHLHGNHQKVLWEAQGCHQWA